MNAPSIDIKDLLVDDSSLGLTFASNLFVGIEPKMPKNSVTIFDTMGFPPEMVLQGASGYEYPSIQIRVRNCEYLDGWKLANDIKDSLHGRAQGYCNGTLYSLISCVGGPAFLDVDDTGNSRFIINFNLQRR